MINSKTRNSWVPYLVISVLFIFSVIFNDFVDIAGVRPDILLILLIFLALREKPLVAICAAFALGLIQDLFLPGDVHYWGLAPLFKTLLIFSLLKLNPLIERLRGFSFQLSIFGCFFVYFIFYNMLYYSGFMKPFVIFYRYAVPELIYTFLIYLIFNMIFPPLDQKR